MKEHQNRHFASKAVHNPGLYLWVYFWYMTVVRFSNVKVVFLRIELDISGFPKSPYSLNFEFIWIWKYLDEVWAFVDWISDWASLSILKISWAKYVQIRWFKIFWKAKTIIYNFHEDIEGWINCLHSPKIANLQNKSWAHSPDRDLHKIQIPTAING